MSHHVMAILAIILAVIGMATAIFGLVVSSMTLSLTKPTKRKNN